MLTLPLLAAGVPPEAGKLVGLGGFWVLAIVLAMFPLTLKLEIEDGEVRSYFLGFCTKELRASDVHGWPIVFSECIDEL
jgi:hypothetical protein